MSTFKQKLIISTGSGILFLLVNLLFSYDISIQSIIFFIATFLTMGSSGHVYIRAGRSLISSVLFLLLSTPFTNKLLNNNLLARTAVYIFLLTLMMYS